MEDWICEDHPWEEMSHDGCKGAGAPIEAQMFLMQNQIRFAKQELKEYKFFAEDMIHGLYRRIVEKEHLKKK